VTIVDEAFVRAAHDLGCQVHVWTVNDEAEMLRLLRLGVDALVTDEARLLRDVLAGWAAGS
jgi:glycerophosphoryl diester phosphodiesterase